MSRAVSPNVPRKECSSAVAEGLDTEVAVLVFSERFVWLESERYSAHADMTSIYLF
jgi:hypothetical protein